MGKELWCKRILICFHFENMMMLMNCWKVMFYRWRYLYVLWNLYTWHEWNIDFSSIFFRLFSNIRSWLVWYLDMKSMIIDENIKTIFISSRKSIVLSEWLWDLKSYYVNIMDGYRFSHALSYKLPHDKTGGDYLCLLNIRQVKINNYSMGFTLNTTRILRWKLSH